MKKIEEKRTEERTDAESLIRKASEICSLHTAGRITSHDALNLLRRIAGKLR